MHPGNTVQSTVIAATTVSSHLLEREEMREIRLYRMRVISLTLGENWQGGDWVSDTAENRQRYEELLRVGVQKFGKGTHWLEERAAQAKVYPSGEMLLAMVH